jgi:hypothetical protein
VDGEHDQAFGLLDHLLVVPNGITVPSLKLDPMLGPVAQRSALPSFDRQVRSEELTRVFSVDMKNILDCSIPETLEEVCDPQRVALLVYDMQVGILNQIKNPEQITLQVLKVLSAARQPEFASCFRGIFHCQKN